jgi:predicted small integral membrane protein
VAQPEEAAMPVTRLAQTALVATIALSLSLVAFGNITDYETNLAFVRHVLLMDTVFPDARIGYRAITNPALHHAAYIGIIAAELLTAALCWIGVARMLQHIGSEPAVFARAKRWPIAGLAVGFVVFQVAFIGVGGEWFGMWMSKSWNGIDSAFRFSIATIAVLIFVALPEDPSLR